MTLVQIEKHALDLPVDDRAALARQLLVSLSETRRDAVRQQVEVCCLEECEKRWFDPSFERTELSDDVWDAIVADDWTDEELDRPLGEGVPPAWTGRTLRAATDKRS